jgi:hypothetical protein
MITSISIETLPFDTPEEEAGPAEAPVRQTQRLAVRIASISVTEREYLPYGNEARTIYLTGRLKGGHVRFTIRRERPEVINQRCHWGGSKWSATRSVCSYWHRVLAVHRSSLYQLNRYKRSLALHSAGFAHPVRWHAAQCLVPIAKKTIA